MDSKPLAGKIALVTGAGQNIGRAIAHDLARDGATVMVNGRGNLAAIESVAAEINAAGGKAQSHLADVSDEGAVRDMISHLVEEAGGIDILVSNAGLRRQTPFVEMSFDEWREILSVALDGAFLLSRHAVPHMKARGGGAIVAMSGISNHIGAKERAHVNASKAGLEGFMRGLAMELAADNITANIVAPGAIDTVRGAAAGARPPGVHDRIPLGRAGTVDEISAMVRHLVGAQGGYVTGQCIHVNGGIFLGH
ncbi:MAG: SDR family NAD(P)-dependent oxidoreductase [Alphaproteobacteria bacterium]|jgi:3-oxoacyl-[acyl-carrier protein] reductase|nr:SDR family NAD(P)-dependent oxidoreductase [Alphaproteobacteria bacterium]MDP6830081.1 SDR family NAD(P)-dependent oxidoreductase [Alphaproteobacteria bacterium]MDP6873777.1 SDR family NAD(P)-dependent oxidoreductase [Alphaproteobacteria bacterium]